MGRSSIARGPDEPGRSSRRVMATQVLRGDHAAVKQLFRRFEKAGDRAFETKQRLFSEIDHELEIHAKVEEEVFYPAVEDEAADAEDLVREAIEEHNVVRTLLGEIAAMSSEDEQYDAKVKVLMENVEHHIEEEEGEMFPKAERLPETRQRELGAELKARKEALGQPTLRRLMNGMTEMLFGGEALRRGAGTKTPASSRKKRGSAAATASRRGKTGAHATAKKR